MKRAYYTAVICGLYGGAALIGCIVTLCSGCGSGQRRLPGDRGPSLIAAGRVAPLPPAVTYPPIESPPAPAEQTLRMSPWAADGR